MSDILSYLRRHIAEIAWTVFTLANLATMYALPTGETIPFHFIWVSLTLLYGFKIWKPKPTTAVLVVVCALTVVLLFRAVSENGAGLDELSEVPLMAAMFMVMAWHARRTQALTDEVYELTDREREFMADFAHDVRTTITIARGHAELIRSLPDRDDTPAIETVVEDAEVILEELDYIARISNRLMLLASARRPDFLHMEPIDLEAVVEGAARRWRSLVRRDWRIVVEPVTIVADAQRLDSALDALIENAVQHTHVPDTIAICDRADGDSAMIEVSDTGDGIDSERLPRVFDRHARSNGSRGCGLGLTIVKAIAEAHGGSVGVASQAGQGSTFSLYLPRAGEALDGRPAVAVRLETGS